MSIRENLLKSLDNKILGEIKWHIIENQIIISKQRMILV